MKKNIIKVSIYLFFSSIYCRNQSYSLSNPEYFYLEKDFKEYNIISIEKKVGVDKKHKKYDYFQVNLTKFENNNSYILVIFKKDLYNMLKNEKSVIISEEANYSVRIGDFLSAANVICLQNDKKCFYLEENYRFFPIDYPPENIVNYYQLF